MKYLRLAALFGMSLVASASYAQTGDYDSGFMGFRVGAMAGLDRFMSRGPSDTPGRRADYSPMALGSLGADTRFGHGFAGLEGSFGLASGKNCRLATRANTPGSTLPVGQTETDCTRERFEYNGTVRVGMITGGTRIYALGGYGAAHLRDTFRNNTTNSNSARSYNASGFHVGAGVELGAIRRHGLFYNAEYRYYNWTGNNSRHALLLGVGLRF